MMVEAREPLRVGRFNSALVLIKEKYIFALGGMIAKNKATE
jgi:hypothetical protein